MDTVSFEVSLVALVTKELLAVVEKLDELVFVVVLFCRLMPSFSRQSPRMRRLQPNDMKMNTPCSELVTTKRYHKT